MLCSDYSASFFLFLSFFFLVHFCGVWGEGVGLDFVIVIPWVGRLYVEIIREIYSFFFGGGGGGSSISRSQALLKFLKKPQFSANL